MPKLLIAQSQLKKKDRKAATSSMNLKKLIEKRVAKDTEDVKYTVVTLNTKMKLANVVAIVNGSIDKLKEHEDVAAIETYTVHPDKTRGKWEIETHSLKPKTKADKPSESGDGDAPKKAKKKGKKKSKKGKE